jgi:ATP-dependent Clp protease protease subunit
MSKPNSRTNQKMTNDKFWQFRNLAGDDQKAELLLYGDISERSWWEDAATPKRFADDLAAMGDVKEITVYINSGGGDVFAAQAIGNMLERNAATVTAHIDGLCASAATIVACHADKVVAAADSSYMVHPVSMGVCDYLTAEDLNNCLKALETIRSSIVTLYAKKSGKTEDECAKWMDETNWWTATEAKEKGFVDEVDDEADDSVVENRNGILFVNSISMNTPFNKAPNFVRSRVVDKTTAQPENTPQADQPGNKTHGEVTDMDIKDIKTVDDLRKACPDMVAKIETEAINAERTRIQEIENATLPGAEDEANEAKFVKPIDSASFAKAVIASMKAKQQKQSKDYLDKAKANAQTSGANNITNPPPADPDPKDAEANVFMAAIRKANGVK